MQRRKFSFYAPLIKVHFICWIENKWTVDCFLSKTNDRNIFSIFVRTVMSKRTSPAVFRRRMLLINVTFLTILEFRYPHIPDESQ